MNKILSVDSTIHQIRRQIHK